MLIWVCIWARKFSFHFFPLKVISHQRNTFSVSFCFSVPPLEKRKTPFHQCLHIWRSITYMNVDVDVTHIQFTVPCISACAQMCKASYLLSLPIFAVPKSQQSVTRPAALLAGICKVWRLQNEQNSSMAGSGLKKIIINGDGLLDPPPPGGMGQILFSNALFLAFSLLASP